jgi:hypothetical protein
MPPKTGTAMRQEIPKTFRFELTNGTTTNVLAGYYETSATFVTFWWDGRDRAGNAVARQWIASYAIASIVSLMPGVDEVSR